MDKFEELKKYKELLDKEIITQEEFDAKKKEVLDQPIDIVVSYENAQTNSDNQSRPNGNQGAQLTAKATGILGYISIVFWLVAYAIGDKEGAKFHLNQALVINLAMMLCVIPVIGWIWAIYMLYAWIAGLVYAIKEEEKEVWLLGTIKLLN